MSKTQVITLRVPMELKERISLLADEQGVSINQLAMYALTEKVTALESEKYFANMWKGKTEAEIMAGFDTVMAKVKERPENEIPEWDRMP